MTDDEIFQRGTEVTGEGQRRTAAEGRADVDTMIGSHYQTRLKIIELEGQIVKGT